MSMRHGFSCVALLAALLLGGCGAQKQPAASPGPRARETAPVVVQGAMPIETDRLVSRLDAVKIETVGGWTFWRGLIDAYPVVVSRTRKGVSNVAAATTIAVERYRPIAIINQGTAGGHDPELRVYDIVLGHYSVNLGAFKTAHRKRGECSNTLEWHPLDLLASEGSAAEDPAARRMRRFEADERLLAAAQSVKHLYGKGRVVAGVIGSSDLWNSELDRIEQLHRQYETSVEEMETASAAQIAGAFQIPFLGVRVLSNNITNGGTYDGTTGEACQEYVYHVVRAYIAATLESRAASVP
jgi:adenosylhomocysteine nucleosidase